MRNDQQVIVAVATADDHAQLFYLSFITYYCYARATAFVYTMITLAI